MDDTELALFILQSLCEEAGGPTEQFIDDWKNMPEADRLPFIKAAQKIKAKILEVK